MPGGERSGGRGGGHAESKQRGSPQVPRGMEESWRGSELKRGKEGLPKLGDTPTDQGTDSLMPPKDRASHLAHNGGVTPGDDPADISGTATSLIDPKGSDQGHMRTGEGPLETDYTSEGIILSLPLAELV